MRGRRRPPKVKSYKFLTSAIRPAPKVLTNRTAEEWVELGFVVSTSSDRVAAIQYVKSKSELYVGFRDGVTCRYYNVDENTAKDMFNANSMGLFVKMRLDGFFSYSVV